MPPAQWPLHNDRPVIEVMWSLPNGRQDLIRRLLSHLGAGWTGSSTRFVTTLLGFMEERSW